MHTIWHFPGRSPCGRNRCNPAFQSIEYETSFPHTGHLSFGFLGILTIPVVNLVYVFAHFRRKLSKALNCRTLQPMQTQITFRLFTRYSMLKSQIPAFIRIKVLGWITALTIPAAFVVALPVLTYLSLMDMKASFTNRFSHYSHPILSYVLYHRFCPF